MIKQEFMAINLPHGLCVISECDLDNRDYDEICIYKPYHYTDEFIEKFITSDVQLAILRPLSDLTKEIEHKGERFVPIVELAKMNRFIEDSNANHIITDTGAFIYKVYCDEYVDFAYDSKHNCFSAFDKDSCLPILISNQLYLFLKLIKWHFDIAGLIEKGEAIDVNTLPENPYK